jgi:DNA polymerase IV
MDGDGHLPASDGSPGPGILHVDMDAFFAAVEVLDDPSLAGRALIVGGEGSRGVVASCSYEARMWGVRSAMPSQQARRRCPHAVFRPGRHDRYSEVSRQIHEVFNRFTPLVEGISLDEAFLDVRGVARLLGPAPGVAADVRTAIRAEVGLSCSVGVAATKFVAKLASEAAKPSADRDGVHPGRGVVVVGIGEELDFLHPLPVEALWGVGPATSARLRALGIATVGQLASVPVEAVERSLGRAVGRHLHSLAHGLDPRAVEPQRPVKSVGHEETYAQDRRDRDGLHREIVRMADAVGTRLRRAGLTGRTVQLKVRFPDFTTVTRARTLAGPVSAGPDIEAVASALLRSVDVDGGIRLLGVSVSSLGPAGSRPDQQLRLRLDLPDAPLVADDDAASAGTGLGTAGRRQGTASGDRTGRRTTGWGKSDSAEVGPPGAEARPAASPTRLGPTGITAPPPGRWEAATEAVDAVRARYGDEAVGPAALLGHDGLRIGRSSDNRWDAVPGDAPGVADVDAGRQD